MSRAKIYGFRCKQCGNWIRVRLNRELMGKAKARCTRCDQLQSTQQIGDRLEKRRLRMLYILSWPFRQVKTSWIIQQPFYNEPDRVLSFTGMAFYISGPLIVVLALLLSSNPYLDHEVALQDGDTYEVDLGLADGFKYCVYADPFRAAESSTIASVDIHEEGSGPTTVVLEDSSALCDGYPGIVVVAGFVDWRNAHNRSYVADISLTIEAGGPGTLWVQGEVIPRWDHLPGEDPPPSRELVLALFIPATILLIAIQLFRKGFLFLPPSDPSESAADDQPSTDLEAATPFFPSPVFYIGPGRILSRAGLAFYVGGPIFILLALLLQNHPFVYPAAVIREGELFEPDVSKGYGFEFCIYGDPIISDDTIVTASVRMTTHRENRTGIFVLTDRSEHCTRYPGVRLLAGFDDAPRYNTADSLVIEVEGPGKYWITGRALDYVTYPTTRTCCVTCFGILIPPIIGVTLYRKGFLFQSKDESSRESE